jgi:hypothetical protein
VCAPLRTNRPRAAVEQIRYSSWQSSDFNGPMRRLIGPNPRKSRKLGTSQLRLMAPESVAFTGQLSSCRELQHCLPSNTPPVRILSATTGATRSPRPATHRRARRRTRLRMPVLEPSQTVVAAAVSTKLDPVWTPSALIGQALSRIKGRTCRDFVRVSDGIRTRDRRDHNPELYQLSYAHQALRI